MPNNSIKDNNHILWIDIAKGIGCILVVLGHFWYDAPHPKVNILIYSFHIALFFICAGFVFKIKNDSKFFNNIFIKFKRLIIPSIFFIIFGVIMKFIINDVTSYTELFKQIIFWEGFIPFNDPVWFFIVLFEIYFIAYLIFKNKLNTVKVLILTLFSFVLGYIVYEYKVFVPFGLNRALLCLGFFNTGILIRKVYDYFKNKKYKLLLIIIFIVSILLWIITALSNGKVTIYAYNLGNYWLLMLSGIFGSITLLIISYLLSFIKYSKIFIKISSSSIFLIGTHYFLRYYLRNLAESIWFTNKYMIYIIIMTVVIVLIYIPISKFLDKHLPFLTGNINKRSISGKEKQDKTIY